MRIAQIAPLHESVPPKLYGGTERVVSYLTEELVGLGHHVTLFASGDSETSARLVPCCARALRLHDERADALAPHVLMFERVAEMAGEFDIMHFHTDYLHFAHARRLKAPSVTTLHGRLDLPQLPALYREFAELPLVSISNHQRQPIAWARFVTTVHHGLPRDLHCANRTGGDYLVFFGRISPEKRPDWAIRIARAAGVDIKIAAKIALPDREYFEQSVAPLLNEPGVTFLGEINEAQKTELVGGALATIFPIDWPEPFGLVMIESLACGTPVITCPCGSVPEIIEDGISGFIARDFDDLVSAVSKARTLDRRAVRDCFERRFTADRMAHDYLAVYQRLIRADAERSAARQPEIIHG